MPLIQIEIETCIDCPKVKSEMPTHYCQTESDYSCTLLKRKLARNVERAREMPPVPDDCPLRPGGAGIIAMKEALDVASRDR
jgi:hypothetical protein